MEKPKLLEVIGYEYPNEKSKQLRKYGVFECPACGKHFKSQTYNVKNGNTTSCGCVRLEMSKKAKLTHGMSYSRLFYTWTGIRQRCYNKNCEGYKKYGAKGVTVCDEWTHSFESFMKWALSNGYTDDLTINRIHGSKEYSPETCEWTNYFKQNQDKRLLISTNTSGYRGVSLHRNNIQWISRISNNNKSYYLGCFNSKEEAALAYNNFVIKNKTHHPINIII